MTDADPLADADVGETVTIEHTEEVWIDRFEDPNARGGDRFRESRITNVELVEDEYGDPSVAVTVESDVTKRLPRRWDAARAPRTDSGTSRGWASKLARLFVGVGLPLGIVFGVTHAAMSRLSGDVTINGAPLSYSVWDLAPVVAIVLIAVMIVFALPRLPRPGPRGGAR